jgi:hypothetical protein
MSAQIILQNYLVSLNSSDTWEHHHT